MKSRKNVSKGRVSYLKEENNSGAFLSLFKEIAKALVKDDLLLPLGED